MSPIKKVILLCVAIYLSINYHLFRQCRKILVEYENKDSSENKIRDEFLPVAHLVRENRAVKTFRFRPNKEGSMEERFTTKTIATATENNNTTTTFLGTSPRKNNWAYAFLVSGCSEEKPGYKGFLYNCVVAATILRDSGSVADVVVMVQMSGSTESKTLPFEEERLLLDNGIKIRYLPKMRSKDNECFYALVQEKFRVLQMIEYSRVLFLDSDVMPLCNLDYMFKLSETSTPLNMKLKKEPLLAENVILAGRNEAAHGGFFMLTPREGDWEQLQSVIRRKEEKALRLPWPHWDEIEGWGHEIVPPDYWIGRNSDEKKSLWDWHAVFADQGLLYYWTKYVKMDVSIITGLAIEKWSRNKDGEGVFRENVQSPSMMQMVGSSFGTEINFTSPLCDYNHFTGFHKPWDHDLRSNVSEGNFTRHKQTFKLSPKNAEYINLWRGVFLKVIKDRPDFDFIRFSWNEGSQPPEPPMGRFSTYAQMIRHIKSKKDHNWTHYKDL